MIKIAASILSADFNNLKTDVVNAITAGSDLIHLDIMDGVFVPNITFGPCVVKSLPRIHPAEYDVHLMVSKPENQIQAFAELGFENITFHIEATSEPDLCLKLIKDNHIKASIGINSGTPISTIEKYLDRLDSVLVLTVTTGFGGQKLIEGTIPKIEALKNQIIKRGLKTEVAADGGINKSNIKRLSSAGLDIATVGSAIFDQPDYHKAIEELKAL